MTETLIIIEAVMVPMTSCGLFLLVFATATSKHVYLLAVMKAKQLRVCSCYLLKIVYRVVIRNSCIRNIRN